MRNKKLQREEEVDINGKEETHIEDNKYSERMRNIQNEEKYLQIGESKAKENLL